MGQEGTQLLVPAKQLLNHGTQLGRVAARFLEEGCPLVRLQIKSFFKQEFSGLLQVGHHAHPSLFADAKSRENQMQDIVTGGLAGKGIEMTQRSV